jgi:hypothetical protein
MTDEEFMAALESCLLPASQFNHAAHVRAGYVYLRRQKFAHANPDLLRKDALLALYSRAALDSTEARARFVLPTGKAARTVLGTAS